MKSIFFQQIKPTLENVLFWGQVRSQFSTSLLPIQMRSIVKAMLYWQKPNLLLLDELTNHLDLGMRAAIEIALQSYDGALVLISHDRHLLRTAVDDFYLVYQQKVQPFKGSLDDYHQWLQTKERTKESAAPAADTVYREKRSLQNRLKKLEQQMVYYREKMMQLDLLLAYPLLYEATEKLKLQALVTQRADCLQQLQKIEEEWLVVMKSL